MKKIILKTKPIPINQKYGVMNGRMLLQKKYRDTKEAMTWETKGQWQNEPMEGDVALNVLFYYGDKRKRDIDTYLKILLDSMEGIVYKNDCQINEMHVFKETVDKNDARVEIQVL